MIYLFVGENYFRKKLLKSWKDAFSKKFSEHNIIHISNIFDYELSFFEQNLLGGGFFSEKNLFIIDDFPFGSDEENSENISKIQNYFLNIIPKINTENIVVLNNNKVDKRSKVYKEILKIGEIKDFTINDEKELFSKLQEIYSSKISKNALEKIIELKGLNFGNITGELDKILITKDFIEIDDLALITKDIEESIFDIINALLQNQRKTSILKFRELAEYLDNPYLLYNSLASNLRTYFYMFKLRLIGKSNSEIKEILNLGNREFLVDRIFKIDKIKLINIYERIASIDGKMKTGKMFGSENSDMIYEIERCLIC
ncbi:MAG: hypothetical protein PHE25_02080 [Candidatus Gracilibacteria bacterium]|nr:hypothetical protein [Candidatus Gracilibacteria bacterium]